MWTRGYHFARDHLDSCLGLGWHSSDMVHVIWYAGIGPGSAASGKEDGLMRIGCE